MQRRWIKNGQREDGSEGMHPRFRLTHEILYKTLEYRAKDLQHLAKERRQVRANRRHTSRLYIIRVRQCSTLRRVEKKRRPAASMSDRLLYVCFASSLSKLTDVCLPGRPWLSVGRFTSSSPHSVRVRSVQTDRLSSVARLSCRTFDILVSVDRLGRSISCMLNAVC